MKSLTRTAIGILLLLVCAIGNLRAQEVVISGQLIDADTGEPVIAAHIIKPDSTGGYSGRDGYFRVTCDRLPLILRISHITYGETEITIEPPLPEELVIRLEKAVSQVGEVQVTGERMRILSEKEDFTIQDFAFDQTKLWMIGYLNNQANQGRLWLCDWYGDTLSSLPVRAPQQLFRDVFGSVHLIMRDFAYQLYAYHDSIIVVDSVNLMQFSQTMEPIKAGFNGKLVYQTFLPQQEGLHTYYYGTDDAEPRFLACIRDTLEESRQEYDHVYGPAGARLQSLAMMTDDFQRASAMLAMGQHKLTKDFVVNRTVKTPLFAVRDTLYLIHLYKDSLLSYGPDGQFKAGIPIDFHRDSLLFARFYKSSQFLVDPIADRVFNLERTNLNWDLRELDIHTGQLLPPIPLKEFPGMYRVTAFGGAIYFLYPEKKWPYYTRLYRFQL